MGPTKGGAGQASAAWREYSELLEGLASAPDFWRSDFARALLPHLIIARQEFDGAANLKARRKGKGAQGG